MAIDPPSRLAAFPIAIVGMACRFPGADNPDSYWNLLKSRIDAVGTVPRDRWDSDYYYNPDPGRAGKMYTRAGGFLREVGRFDAEFFGISPREAAQMDPQQRLALEVSWEALEDAGIIPGDIAGSDASVVMGVSSNDYAALQREEGDGSDPYTMSGSAFSLLANRISYFYDIHGPSFSLDTACSSALVAVHQACETLRHGEASLAIAGGVNLLLSPWGAIGFSRARMLSPSGHCHAFDAQADGYVRSEGGGVVILKPLEAAIADGNPVHAVILATGVNSDGRTPGVSMPNRSAQEMLLRRVYAAAGIDPGRVDYVEAHGTGTGVGDPVECGAIGAVIGGARDKGDPCLIGSGKTNIGHLESAAGIAGLLKVVLSLRHRELPATLGFETPNPKIAFADLNLAVVDRHTPVRAGPRPSVMGVNSFGFGGTNAHAVLEEYRPDASSGEAASAPADTLSLLLISAQSEAALSELARRYETLLRDGEADHVAICRAAARARSHHPHRLAVVGRSAGALADRLRDFVASDASPEVSTGTASATPRVAFVYSGNGAQWFGMGRDLVAREPLIREWVGRIDRTLGPITGWSLVDLFSAGDPPEDIYDRTEIAQPALFALQVALVEWLRAKGLAAEAHLGHSVGEVAAAYGAGALTLDEACRVIAHRSAVQAKTAGLGRMAAAGIAAHVAGEKIAPYGDAVTIAAYNSPRAVTLAGDAHVLNEIGAQFEADGLFYRHLALNYAFHSRVMDPFRDELLGRLSGLKASPCDARFISTVSGRERRGDELGAEYWWDNIREPVRFADAMSAAIGEGIEVFLEIGPHQVLGFYVRECLNEASAPGSAIPTLRRDEPEAEALVKALGTCYTAGVTLDYARMSPGRGPWHELPAYPWQGEPYAFARRARPQAPMLGPKQHALLGYRLPTALPSWEHTVEPWLLPYLEDHVVQGSMVFPAAGYVEMALAAGRLHFGSDTLTVEGFRIQKPVVVTVATPPRFEVTLSPDDNSFRISAAAGDEAKAAVTASGRVLPLATRRSPIAVEQFVELRDRLTACIDGAEHYRACADHGLAYGQSFQGVSEVWAGDDEALGRIVTPAALAGSIEDYLLHPALLDASIQVVFACFAWGMDQDRRAAYVPVAIDRLRLHRTGGQPAWCHARLRDHRGRAAIADFVIADETGVLAEIEGLHLQRLDAPAVPAIPRFHWEARMTVAARRGSAAGSVSVAELAASIEPILAVPGPGEAIAPNLEQIAVGYAARALDRLSDRAGAVAFDDLIAAGSVARRQLPYLRALLGMLERHGVVIRTAEGWRRTGAAVADPEGLWRRSVAAHPIQFPGLELVARCGEELPRFLAAEPDQDHNPTIARNIDVVEQLLETDLFRRRNEAAAAAARRLLAAKSDGDPLRLLEVGGGPAGLATAILPLLPPDRTEYVYIDADTDGAERTAAIFGDRPNFEARVLDIGGDAELPAGYAARFDLVLVGNAMFGVAELKPALARVASLLKPGGHVLVATAGNPDMLTFLFGLSPRWWSFADIELRRDSPLLSARAWSELLADVGFVEATNVVRCESTGWPGSAVLARKAIEVDEDDDARPDPAAWLIVAASRASPDIPVAAALARRLEASGSRVTTLGLGDDVLSRGPAGQDAASADWQSFREVLEAVSASAETAALRVAYFGSGAAPTKGGDPGSGPEDSFGLVTLYQAIDALGLTSRVALWVVTSGAMAAPGRHLPPDPARAMLWGVARTVMTERSDLSCRLVDLDPSAAPERASALLFDEVLCREDAVEDEVVLCGEGRYVHRLARGMPLTPVPGAVGYRLVLAEGAGRDDLALRAEVPRGIAADEMRVRVRAGGLNFRDVLQRTTVLPQDAFEGGFSGATLGMEFAGEVVAVGADLTRFRVGDRVYGFAPAALGSDVVTDDFAVFAMPAGWSFAEAASVLVAAITAIYGLEYLARTKAGERVLVHGAAGGVGLAAIQLARHIGAEIFATAGTPEKRDFLRRLGVRHVFDSRTLDFADEIRAITQGEGVDVILNSIAGEAIPKGIALLRPFGRFIELGKRDFFANSKVGLEPFRRNIQFFGVDIDRMLQDQRSLSTVIFGRLVDLTTKGVLRPIATRIYPVTRAAEAFRHLQQSRHIGKIVLTFPQDAPMVEPALPSRLVLAENATYLVTGGRGGFGLATAAWLVERGARHLVLVGRRATETRDPDAASALERLRSQGVTVTEAACDVADGVALSDLLAAIARDLPPLRGVIHAAGVIDDALLAKLTRELYDRVVRPKVHGAYNLHRMTQGQPLDFFVVYSSAMSLIGNPGQASYVAANLYLEALVRHRRARGLPGLAMLWGAIAEVGYLARNSDLARGMTERFGVVPIAPRRALDDMETALIAGAGELGVAELDWTKLARLPEIARAPKYAAVIERENGEVNLTSTSGLAELVRRVASLSIDEATALIAPVILKQVSDVMRIPASKFDVDRSLIETGMDSMMMVELQVMLERQFGLSISVLDLMDRASITGISRRIVEEIHRQEPSSEPKPASIDDIDIDSLPENELDALLGRLIKEEELDGGPARREA
jgi:acyl transferase domain-containing protein/NADPH:quinone reductase-like Zn-dependent oxidoreductase/NAD(P)-dependent dehydrogenase (short-subunit alcohol dehydrogenase family)/acyl carrier protein